MFSGITEKHFFPPSEFWKAVPVPQARSQRDLLPDGRLMRRTSRKWLSRRLRTEPERERSLRALAERRAGRGWSRTPASSARNLLSPCLGRGYPGRSYPSGRESAPGEPEPPQKCDGRRAGTEDRTEVGVKAGDVILRSSPHPNEASISRKSRPTTLTKMFVPCVRISQCSAP